MIFVTFFSLVAFYVHHPLEGAWWHDDVPNHYCIRSCSNTISNALMMEVWNSHGKWEVPKPYLIGGSADPMLVCIGDAQILTFLTYGYFFASYLQWKHYHHHKNREEDCSWFQFFQFIYKSKKFLASWLFLLT